MEVFETESQAREKTEELEAQRWAQEFEIKHKEVLSDPERRDRFLQFLSSDFTPDIAISLVQETNENIVNTTISYTLQGVPEQYALRMARQDHGQPETEAAKPRVSAQITAGASAAANVPDSAEKSVSDNAFNIRDARRLAVDRAFKRRVG